MLKNYVILCNKYIQQISINYCKKYRVSNLFPLYLKK